MFIKEFGNPSWGSRDLGGGRLFAQRDPGVTGQCPQSPLPGNTMTRTICLLADQPVTKTCNGSKHFCRVEDQSLGSVSSKYFTPSGGAG